MNIYLHTLRKCTEGVPEFLALHIMTNELNDVDFYNLLMIRVKNVSNKRNL